MGCDLSVKSRVWILILAAVLAVSVVLSLPLLLPGEAASFAQIRSDGELIATVDLSQDQTFPVVSQYGTNIVTVSDGKIAVTEADCPDHYCMDRGFCNSGTMIVCLPNKLVIEFVGGNGVDGAVG